MLLKRRDSEMEEGTEVVLVVTGNVYYNENMPGGNVGKLI
jgi:hypothetical protein